MLSVKVNCADFRVGGLDQADALELMTAASEQAESAELFVFSTPLVSFTWPRAQGAQGESTQLNLC